jgi:hypothetical protein
MHTKKEFLFARKERSRNSDTFLFNSSVAPITTSMRASSIKLSIEDCFINFIYYPLAIWFILIFQVFSKAGEINLILEKQCSCTSCLQHIDHKSSQKHQNVSLMTLVPFLVDIYLCRFFFCKVSRMFNIFNLSFNKFNAVNQVYFYHLWIVLELLKFSFGCIFFSFFDKKPSFELYLLYSSEMSISWFWCKE